MERNDDLGTPGPESGSSQADANEFSGSGGAGSAGTGAAGSARQQPGGFDFQGSSESQNLRDRARGALGSANERLADVGSTVRDKAGSVKNKLANALESGADRLRNTGGGTFAGATTEGTTAIETDGRLTNVTDRVAGGMQATADWLRDADVDGIKTGIERQVREHPARTLLIAAGLGYLIGRAFRGEK